MCARVQESETYAIRLGNDFFMILAAAVNLQEFLIKIQNKKICSNALMQTICERNDRKLMYQHNLHWNSNYGYLSNLACFYLVNFHVWTKYFLHWIEFFLVFFFFHFWIIKRKICFRSKLFKKQFSKSTAEVELEFLVHFALLGQSFLGLKVNSWCRGLRNLETPVSSSRAYFQKILLNVMHSIHSFLVKYCINEGYKTSKNRFFSCYKL